MIYRLRQMVWALTARPLAERDVRLLATLLTPAEHALFDRYAAAEQQHTLRIVRRLQQAGATDRALLKAALMHDIGKTRLPLNVLDRSLIVIASRLIPGIAHRWGCDPQPPYRWRKPFVVKRWHAQWGAEMATNAGVDPLTVWLIRRHEDRLEAADDVKHALLQQLQRADDQS